MLIPAGISILLHAIAWSQQQTWDIYRYIRYEFCTKHGGSPWQTLLRSHHPLCGNRSGGRTSHPLHSLLPSWQQPLIWRKSAKSAKSKGQVFVGVKLWISWKCQVKKCCYLSTIWLSGTPLIQEIRLSASGPDLFTCCVLHRLDLLRCGKVIFPPPPSWKRCKHGSSSADLWPLQHRCNLHQGHVLSQSPAFASHSWSFQHGWLQSFIDYTLWILQKPLFGL